MIRLIGDLPRAILLVALGLAALAVLAALATAFAVVAMTVQELARSDRRRNRGRLDPVAGHARRGA